MGYFQSDERTYSLTMFVACSWAVAAMAALTSDQTDSSEVLSAYQCDAWRGVLVLTYISLQYCGVDQVVAGRLFGELLVGGLVFISGYTYFSHYWKHSQFNWRRIGYVLFRVNLLPVLLSLTLGVSYGVYILPILLSLGFLFTSAFMASWPQMTPASLQGMSGQGPQHVVVAVKFGFAFLFISFLPWIKGILKGLASLPLMGWVVGTGADVRTLYHWIYTQRYMTLGGMVFGYVMCTVQSNSVSTSSDGLRRLRIVIIPFSLLIMLGYGIFLVSATNFEQSSESQSLIAQPVIISYALLRYFSKPLRRYESHWLGGVGSLSVWLFVSHQHILLDQSGFRLLTLFPSVPWPVNSLLVLCVFLFCLRLMQFGQKTLSGSSGERNAVAHPSTAHSKTLPLSNQ
jgi:hypothetical protein